MPGAPGKFTAKKLAETFAAISNGGRMLEEMDVDYGRSTRADRQIQDVLACSLHPVLLAHSSLSKNSSVP